MIALSTVDNLNIIYLKMRLDIFFHIITNGYSFVLFNCGSPPFFKAAPRRPATFDAKL